MNQSNRLCPYLTGCEVDDIRDHNCGSFEVCEIYQINEIFKEAYGCLGIKKTYGPILRPFELSDLENEIDNNCKGENEDE